MDQDVIFEDGLKTTCLCLLSTEAKGKDHQGQLGYSLGKNCFVDDIMVGGMTLGSNTV